MATAGATTSETNVASDPGVTGVSPADVGVLVAFERPLTAPGDRAMPEENPEVELVPVVGEAGPECDGVSRTPGSPTKPTPARIPSETTMANLALPPIVNRFSPFP